MGAFDQSYGAGGLASSLEDILKQKFIEQMTKQKLAEEIRQADMQHAIQRGQLGLGERRLSQDASQFERTAGQNDKRIGYEGDRLTLDQQMQPVRLRLSTAQASDIERRPQAEQEARDFTTKRDATQHGYQMGEIGAQGANALRVANIRAENEPVVRIQTVNEKGEPIIKIVPRSQAAGQEFAAAPTTEQRNRQAASGRSTAVVQAIADLSERINTGQGVAAKISGAAERAKAQANLNDDISEYEAVVSGFTPLLARAVGHTGVLTEQDVQSVRRMLPQPTDSKSIRDRKVKRIQELMGALGGTQGGGDNTKPDYRKKYDY